EKLAAPASPSAPATGSATPAAPDAEYYAQLEGRAALFTVTLSDALLQTLRTAQETLREKRLLDFEKNTVTAIALTAPNSPPLTLQRLEAADPAEAPWQIVRRGDATQGVQTLPADPAAVKRLLDQLAAAAAKDVKGFVSDAPSAADLENWGFNRPEREATLTLGPNTPPLTLQIGLDSAGAAYARIGSATSSIYAIDAPLLGELRVEPRAWRQRALRAPLPAAARFTALKLTDLANHTVLLDAAWDATGTPKSKIENQKSVDTVLAQLRALRAKSFFQDHFADTVNFAGADRPWRFKLEALAALPAGGPEITLALLLSERGGGAQQLAALKEADAVFEIEQPFLDALWPLTEGRKDPGPPPEPKK
ncbi:MAG: hypothetical protein RLZZ15_987, partial [Verrucomicrobiota bacterium]